MNSNSEDKKRRNKYQPSVPRSQKRKENPSSSFLWKRDALVNNMLFWLCAAKEQL
jgi:hypothetical protein